MATCKAPGCGRELEQAGGGHRRREYCNDACRQSAYYQRREQQHKDDITRRWSRFTPGTRNFLDWHMGRYGEDAATAIELAILHECAIAREAGNDRIAQLEQQHNQQTGALREKQLRRVDRLKARIAELEQEQTNVTRLVDNDCTNMAARVQELEQELARYREIINLSDREKLEMQFLALGEGLHYTRFINPWIDPGIAAWTAYAHSESDEMLAQAVRSATSYYQIKRDLGMLS